MTCGTTGDIDETSVSLLDEISARNGFGALTDELRVIVYVCFRQEQSLKQPEKRCREGRQSAVSGLRPTKWSMPAGQNPDPKQCRRGCDTSNRQEPADCCLPYHLPVGTNVAVKYATRIDSPVQKSHRCGDGETDAAASSDTQ